MLETLDQDGFPVMLTKLKESAELMGAIKVLKCSVKVNENAKRLRRGCTISAGRTCLMALGHLCGVSDVTV